MGDDSACMANLWVGRSLEFFVVMFDLLRDGKTSQASSEIAYARTLQGHHNFFQRQAFNAALMLLPSRQHILELLKGDECDAAVIQEIDQFVAYGHSIFRFCAQMDGELQTHLKEKHACYE